MWLGLKLSYLGASSVGCLSLAVMVSTAWERGFPPRISKGLPCHWLLLLLNCMSHAAPRQPLLVLPATLPSLAYVQVSWWQSSSVRCAWPAGARKYYPKDCDSKLTVLWIILVQPLLFGAIGIEIDFRAIQGSLIWKTVIILALGQLCSISSEVQLRLLTLCSLHCLTLLLAFTCCTAGHQLGWVLA